MKTCMMKLAAYTMTAMLLINATLPGAALAETIATPGEIVTEESREEEPTETPTEASTEEPTEASTEASTEESTEASTEASTEESTEASTEAPTEESTEASTEAPMEESTETPTEAPTEEPTEAPTEAPTEEPTEAPTEAPTEEPTETSAPLTLSGLKPGKEIYALGETVSWTFACAGAETLTWVITAADGSVAASGEAGEATEVCFVPERAGRYTLHLTAQRGEERQEAVSGVTVTDGDCMAALTTQQRYARAGKIAMTYTAIAQGGVAPYTLCFRVTLNGETVHEETTVLNEAGSATLTYMPETYGVHEATLTVTDAAGASAQAVMQMPVAEDDREAQSAWEQTVSGVRLTGDWRIDLPAIARTQLGYEESKTDFIIDEEGKTKGWTRYGEWYGSAYGDWCAMFVSFCLNYAEIPERYVPREANCSTWAKEIKALGCYESAEGYAPQSGDLIYLNGMEHMGIVEWATETTVYTIEGNVGQQVTQKSYSLSDGHIAGYASMEKLMDRAGVLEQFATPEPTEAPASTESPEPTEEDDVFTTTPEPTEAPASTESPKPTEEDLMFVATPEPTGDQPDGEDETQTEETMPEVIDIPVYCGKAEHEHTEACYDETGLLICGQEEHIHTDACLLQDDPPAEAEEIVFDASWGGDTLGAGDLVTLTARAEDAEGILWQYMDAAGAWHESGAAGASYTFELTEENAYWTWRASRTAISQPDASDAGLEGEAE